MRRSWRHLVWRLAAAFRKCRGSRPTEKARQRCRRRVEQLVRERQGASSKAKAPEPAWEP